MKYRIKMIHTQGGKIWYLPQTKRKFKLLNPYTWFWKTIDKRIGIFDLGFHSIEDAENELWNEVFCDEENEKWELNKKPKFTATRPFDDAYMDKVSKKKRESIMKKI